MPEREPYSQEQRRYIRLDTVFPVEFRVMGVDGRSFLSDWLQGFTRNIGKGGICLEVNNLTRGLIDIIKSRQGKLSLKIEMPVIKNPVGAIASIAWFREPTAISNKYSLGLSYEEINPQQNNRIMLYARLKKLFIPLTLAALALLAGGIITGSYINLKLIQRNKAMVEQLVKVIQERNMAKEKIKEISDERFKLEQKMRDLNSRIEALEKEKAKIEDFSSQIEKLTQEKTALQDELLKLRQREDAASLELSRLDKRKTDLEKVNLDKMYKWLTIHQNPRTGLVISFEGDSNIANWAFIYDQSLVSQAYTLVSDFERAKKLLDFFSKKAKRSAEKFFYNAYYVNDGTPAEYIAHSGPNIWLGIAALQYTVKTNDKAYLNLAEDIAQAVIYLQALDKDGGIKGGTGVEWYSTEHNLDGYAFFDMLYKLTAKERYQKARNKALTWLTLHIYDKTDVPIMRGKGDSTIATDTYAWSIAAIGPQKLEGLQMSADRILEFAEDTCGLEVDYLRPDGRTVKIKGFDFAPQKHLARGGVVSPEWTAQMAISFKIMADFYDKKNMPAKANEYEAKANEYLEALGNMIISSPSPSGQGESCLPYATQENVDTGHGWITPKGKSTGSVAATAYTFFAYNNYNPLKLKE